MPNYTYVDDTGEEHDVSLTIAEWEKLLEDNPQFKWVPKRGLGTVDPIRIGRQKVDDGFNDLLKTVKKGSPGSFINTK